MIISIIQTIGSSVLQEVKSERMTKPPEHSTWRNLLRIVGITGKAKRIPTKRAI
jgi:hypothetical protein